MKKNRLKIITKPLSIIFILLIISCCAVTKSANETSYIAKVQGQPIKETNIYADTNQENIHEPNKKYIALTFDDGPHITVTEKILDILKKNNAKATFFVIGLEISPKKSYILKEISNAGCQIGNHTFNHKNLTMLTESKIMYEIESTDALIKSVTGESASLLRPPFGSVNDKVKSVISYPLITWSIDTEDWKNRDASKIVSNIKENVKDGSIILMHDIYKSSADACEEIIPWLISEGYCLVTVSELMQIKNVSMQAGCVYRMP